MRLSNVLIFPAKGLGAPAVPVDLNCAVGIERMRHSTATLSNALCRQERLAARIGDLVDTLPDGPTKSHMRRRMKAINLQIAQGFATCEAVDRILRNRPGAIAWRDLSAGTAFHV
jgi:hypothetical protein